jgi:hypothetical protein
MNSLLNILQLKPRFGDPREPMRNIIGDDLANRCKRIWGLDNEKEIRGVWRDLGIPHLWAMMGKFTSLEKAGNDLNGVVGNLAMCRFHSKHVALRM